MAELECPQCHSQMKFASKGMPDDGTVEVYICPSCLHYEEWYPEKELVIESYEPLPTCPYCHGSGLRKNGVNFCRHCNGEGVEWWRS